MKNFITTSKIIAVLSFVIGTILFALQLYNSNEYKLIYVGILFIKAAVIINTILLLRLAFGLIVCKNKQESLKTIGIILANIPIAILYFYILIKTI